MTEPRIPVRGSGGNGRVYGQPAELFTERAKRDRRRAIDWRGIATGVAVFIAVSIVSGAVSFIASSAQAADQVHATANRVEELRIDVEELRRKQVQADIDAARLAGNYEAVVKGVDQRLQLMQNQLDRIERQR